MTNGRANGSWKPTFAGQLSPIVALALLSACATEDPTQAGGQLRQRLTETDPTVRSVDVISYPNSGQEPLVFIRGPGNIGSGVLLSPNVVLTAAHVVDGIFPDDIRVRHGWRSFPPPVSGTEVRASVVYPLGNDLALVRLKASITDLTGGGFYGTVDTAPILPGLEPGPTSIESWLFSTGPCLRYKAAAGSLAPEPEATLCHAKGITVLPNASDVLEYQGETQKADGHYLWVGHSADINEGDSGSPVYFERTSLGGDISWGPGVGAIVSRFRWLSDPSHRTRSGKRFPRVVPLAPHANEIALGLAKLGGPTLSSCAFLPKSSVLGALAPRVICVTIKNTTTVVNISLGYEDEHWEDFPIDTGVIVDAVTAIVPVDFNPEEPYPTLAVLTPEAAIFLEGAFDGVYLDATYEGAFASGVFGTVATTDASGELKAVLTSANSRDAIYVSRDGQIVSGNAVRATLDVDAVEDLVVYDPAAHGLRVRPSGFPGTFVALQDSLRDPELRLYAFPLEPSAEYDDPNRNAFADQMLILGNGQLMFCPTNGYGGLKACSFVDLPSEGLTELRGERYAETEAVGLIAGGAAGTLFQWESEGGTFLPGAWRAISGAHRGQQEGVLQEVGSGAGVAAVRVFTIEEPKNLEGAPSGEPLFIDVFDAVGQSGIDADGDVGLFGRGACVRLVPEPALVSHPCHGQAGLALSTECIESGEVRVLDQSELGSAIASWYRVFGNEPYAVSAMDPAENIRRYRLEVFDSDNCYGAANPQIGSVNRFRLRTNGDITSVTTGGNSCSAGSAGTHTACGAVSLGECWCDEWCTSRGDCCADYESVCEDAASDDEVDALVGASSASVVAVPVGSPASAPVAAVTGSAGSGLGVFLDRQWILTAASIVGEADEPEDLDVEQGEATVEIASVARHPVLPLVMLAVADPSLLTIPAEHELPFYSGTDAELGEERVFDDAEATEVEALSATSAFVDERWSRAGSLALFAGETSALSALTVEPRLWRRVEGGQGGGDSVVTLPLAAASGSLTLGAPLLTWNGALIGITVGVDLTSVTHRTADGVAETSDVARYYQCALNDPPLTVPADDLSAVQWIAQVRGGALRKDGNGDGYEDLWGYALEDPDNRLVMVPMEGTVATGAPEYVGASPTGGDWELTARGVMGPGMIGEFWREPSYGGVYIRVVTGEVSPFALLFLLDPEWEIAAVADFDGDHVDDLLLRSELYDSYYFWLMEPFDSFDPDTAQHEFSIAIRYGQWFDGPTTGGQELLAAGPFAAGAAADGGDEAAADLLWRDPSTGAVTLWAMTMHRRACTSDDDPRLQESCEAYATDELLTYDLVYSVGLPAMPTYFSPAGVADFDGDGAVDLGWHASGAEAPVGEAGEVRLWLGDGLGGFSELDVLDTDGSPLVVDPGTYVLGG